MANKWMDIFPVIILSVFPDMFFHVFSRTVFAFASAGSALQALGAANGAGDETPKPA